MNGRRSEITDLNCNNEEQSLTYVLSLADPCQGSFRPSSRRCPQGVRSALQRGQVAVGPMLNHLDRAFHTGIVPKISVCLGKALYLGLQVKKNH